MPPLIIGSGHNGLAAAFYLAKAGLRPIVFERRAEVGGGAITGVLHPGFRCPVLTHETMIHADLAREMGLGRRGIEWVGGDVVACAPALEGPPVVFHADVARTVEGLRTISAADASAYAGFRASVERIARAAAALLTVPPPDIDRPGARDLWTLLRFAGRVRALGRRDGYRALRWPPMPAADFVHEWFEHERVRAAVAAPGLSGTMLGPRSAGGTLVLLLREAHRLLAASGAARVRGGPGALTQAMAAAATAAGAVIRTRTAVDRLIVRNGRVAGVVAGGEEIASPIVLSAIDPKTTFLRLVEPGELPPDLAAAIRNYRAAGTIAKVNLALASLPRFRHLPDDPGLLSGRIHIGPDLDYMERAFDAVKYGERSARPWLEMAVPSVADPALAPSGAHVASIYVHYAPFRLRDGSWNDAREALLASVLETIEPYAPGMSSQVVAAQVITPGDLEQDYGFWGGHVLHGEVAVDQLLAMRPIAGLSCPSYESPIGGLYLCGAGSHPGGFMTGASGRLAAAHVLRNSPRRVRTRSI